MPIDTCSGSMKQEVLAVWDSGSTVSLILNAVDSKMKLKESSPDENLVEMLGPMGSNIH